jgi:hypothetical protein
LAFLGLVAQTGPINGQFELFDGSFGPLTRNSSSAQIGRTGNRSTPSSDAPPSGHVRGKVIIAT